MKTKTTSNAIATAQMTVDVSRTRRVPVTSYQDASNKVRAAIERPGGFGNWIPSSRWHGGTIRDAAGNKIAEVSYNGRVWDLDDKEIATEQTKMHMAAMGGAQ